MLESSLSHSGLAPDAISRRDLLWRTALAGAAAAMGGTQALGEVTPETRPSNRAAAGNVGLLYPQQNPFRNVLDLSGLWKFQLDPKTEGEAAAWYKTLPAPRLISVPCSWNDLFDDRKNCLDLAWYRREVYVPSAWRDQRVFLRVGSANYAAKVWVNGTNVASISVDTCLSSPT